MEFVNTFIALLLVNALLFLFAKRRNRIEARERMNASLQRHVNMPEFQRIEGRYGK